MPTAQVCEKYDEILHAIVTMLDAKKQVDRVEHELRALRNRKAALEGGVLTSSMGPPSAGIASKRRLSISSDGSNNDQVF
jgi:hypothetical protein